MTEYYEGHDNHFMWRSMEDWEIIRNRDIYMRGEPVEHILDWIAWQYRKHCP